MCLHGSSASLPSCVRRLVGVTLSFKHRYDTNTLAGLQLPFKTSPRLTKNRKNNDEKTECTRHRRFHSTEFIARVLSMTEKNVNASAICWDRRVAHGRFSNVSPSEKPSHDARGIATTHECPFTKPNEESMRQRAGRLPLSLPECPSTSTWPVCTQGSEKHRPNRRVHLRISAHNQASRKEGRRHTVGRAKRVGNATFSRR